MANHSRPRTLSYTLLLICALALPVQAQSFYTLQLKLAPNQQQAAAEQLQLPLIYSETFAPGENFAYFGHFANQASAEQQLAQLQQKFGSQLDPLQPIAVEMLMPNSGPIGAALSATDTKPVQTQTLTVATQPLNSISSSRTKSAEHNTSANHHSVQVAPAITSASVDGPVFTIALAAFSSVERAQNFARKHRDKPLLCRVRDNGLFAVYYSSYASRDDADAALESARQIRGVSPYVLRLNSNRFINCDALN